MIPEPPFPAFCYTEDAPDQPRDVAEFLLPEDIDFARGDYEHTIWRASKRNQHVLFELFNRPGESALLVQGGIHFHRYATLHWPEGMGWKVRSAPTDPVVVTPLPPSFNVDDH